MPGAGGLKSSQVAVLVPSGSDREWSVIFKTIPATSDFENWRANKGVLIAPWRRFKGLEADAIVIVESAPDSDDLNERANRYVARSRAKHLLTVIQVDS
jgi:DNA helicase IV